MSAGSLFFIAEIAQVMTKTRRFDSPNSSNRVNSGWPHQSKRQFSGYFPISKTYHCLGFGPLPYYTESLPSLASIDFEPSLAPEIEEDGFSGFPVPSVICWAWDASIVYTCNKRTRIRAVGIAASTELSSSSSTNL
ncbi:hypothetical protein Q3G72_006875 [Acer saccharum]|nr:hypothetical protein Q3G72_002162 [Acer saccharum]KAK1591390.1 hypothetical protein Q3G72_006875 [Acer saccharum]